MVKSELSTTIPENLPGVIANGKNPDGVQTVTRVNLAEAVYQQVGLSRKESAALVEQVLDEITDRLIAGESVRLSSFGSFSVRHKGQRIGRNPKTGVESADQGTARPRLQILKSAQSADQRRFRGARFRVT